MWTHHIEIEFHQTNKIFEQLWNCIRMNKNYRKNRYHSNLKNGFILEIRKTNIYSIFSILIHGNLKKLYLTSLWFGDQDVNVVLIVLGFLHNEVELHLNKCFLQKKWTPLTFVQCFILFRLSNWKQRFNFFEFFPHLAQFLKKNPSIVYSWTTKVSKMLIFWSILKLVKTRL